MRIQQIKIKNKNVRLQHYLWCSVGLFFVSLFSPPFRCVSPPATCPFTVSVQCSVFAATQAFEPSKLRSSVLNIFGIFRVSLLLLLFRLLGLLQLVMNSQHSSPCIGSSTVPSSPIEATGYGLLYCCLLCEHMT